MAKYTSTVLNGRHAVLRDGHLMPIIEIVKLLNHHDKLTRGGIIYEPVKRRPDPFPRKGGSKKVDKDR